MNVNFCHHACGASVFDLFLRDQSIKGVINNNLREQLLQSVSRKFGEVASKALSLEVVKEDAREITLQLLV